MELDEYKHTFPFSSFRAAHHSNFVSKFKKIDITPDPFNDKDDPIKYQTHSGELTSKSSEVNVPVEPPKIFKNKLLSNYRNK